MRIGEKLIFVARSKAFKMSHTKSVSLLLDTLAAFDIQTNPTQSCEEAARILRVSETTLIKRLNAFLLDEESVKCDVGKHQALLRVFGLRSTMGESSAREYQLSIFVEHDKPGILSSLLPALVDSCSLTSIRTETGPDGTTWGRAELDLFVPAGCDPLLLWRKLQAKATEHGWQLDFRAKDGSFFSGI